MITMYYANIVIIILFAVAAYLSISLSVFFLRRRGTPLDFSRRARSRRTMIVLGSGGHTAEMLKLLEQIDWRRALSPLCIVVANTDDISMEKAKKLLGESTAVSIRRLYRSREVAQSWPTTVVSTAYACLRALPLVFAERPDLLLVNGPGTCIPVLYAAVLYSALSMPFLGGRRIYSVFVESFCRVESLSMSGRMAYYVVDDFIVQWPELCDANPRAKYFGRLV